MKWLIVFAGPNGSGKSSLRDLVAGTTDVLIDPDRIARDINPSAPRSADLAAGRRAIHVFNDALRQGRSISLETTLSGRSILQRMKTARDADYIITLVYVTLETADLNVERVLQRVKRGGHGIDPVVIRRRVEESRANFPAALFLSHRTLVVDNSKDQHRKLLEMKGNRIAFQAVDLPDWLAGYLPAVKDGLARRS